VDVNVPLSSKPEELENSVELSVMKEMEIFQAAQVREEAIRKADSGEFEEASLLLSKQKEKLQELCNNYHVPELLEEIRSLEENHRIMGQRTYSARSRKEIKYDSYRARKR
jgi:hypothetical protein